MAKLRGKVALGCWAILGLFIMLAILAGWPLMALGTLGFGAIVSTSLVAIRGIADGDPVADRTRELLLGGGRDDLLTLGAGLVVLGLALGFAGLLGTWVVLGLVAVALAMAYHIAVDRPIRQARVASVDRAHALLRELRKRGVDEDSIRRFVAQQSGTSWEEFYESLFGYGAMRSARTRWGLDAGGGKRPRFARWRDPIVDAVDARIVDRRRLRDRALFGAIEERNLEARGINLLTARRKARRIAEAIVLCAHQSRPGRRSPLRPPLDGGPRPGRPTPRAVPRRHRRRSRGRRLLRPNDPLAGVARHDRPNPVRSPDPVPGRGPAPGGLRDVDASESTDLRPGDRRGRPRRPDRSREGARSGPEDRREGRRERPGGSRPAGRRPGRSKSPASPPRSPGGSTASGSAWRD